MGQKAPAKSEKLQRTVAVAGNPNVGKSTLFNALTGMNQHTGNWTGKTVETAKGECGELTFIDLPGTYSLHAISEEERVARDFLCFGGAEKVLLVADATSLERNLCLVLQTLEIASDVVVCVNMMDEARSKKISIDLGALENELSGVSCEKQNEKAPKPAQKFSKKKRKNFGKELTTKQPLEPADEGKKVVVLGASARNKQGLDEVLEALNRCAFEDTYQDKTLRTVVYPEYIESATAELEPLVHEVFGEKINARWVSLRLLEDDENFEKALMENFEVAQSPALLNLQNTLGNLRETEKFANVSDEIAKTIVERAAEIFQKCVTIGDKDYARRDRKIDKVLTSKATGIPIMLALLLLIFWITITGANYPSQLIAQGLFALQEVLLSAFSALHAPAWLSGVLVLGVYRTLAWVVSVMLPPMAIFFPLFTLLEDSGYLPRIAFNLDRFLQKAGAHGKQALTMCMGFGCNACGVIGCRIIDSPRERLIAILTNNFVPCNGRFPTLIAIISMFFVGVVALPYQSFFSALLLVAVIVFGVAVTFFISKALSCTILKGYASSFVLELPPYRAPQVGNVIVRSIFDRTLFVLGRAVVVSIPAGLVIWFMANIYVGGGSVLTHCATFLDPFARLLGLDGIILLAFILGFPANEIVIPIIIMGYMCTGSLLELASLSEMRGLFTSHGWTWVTAVCTLLFVLLHFPCGTTCLTIKKETGSFKWTVLAFAVPTVVGLLVCFTVASLARVFGLA